MRHCLLLLLVLALALLFAAPANALYIEEKPDFWGAIGTGPVWFDEFGWGVYIQGGYYFTRWIGVGLGVDWSMDARQYMTDDKTVFDDMHGYTVRTWDFERRRQFFPGADLRIRFPIADNFQMALDLGLGVMLDNTYSERRTEVERNDRKYRTLEDTTPTDAEVAFLMRPSLVCKIYNVGVGYRFLGLTSGFTSGHMAFVGMDWDI